jgi:GYF domain 2
LRGWREEAMKDNLEGMPGPVEWYLARDGQQYGPLSDAELTKFRELGHLYMTDLVWRKGFANWMPAAAVFNFAKKAAPSS